MTMGDVENHIKKQIEEISIFIKANTEEAESLVMKLETTKSSIRGAQTDLTRLERALMTIRGDDESKPMGITRDTELDRSVRDMSRVAGGGGRGGSGSGGSGSGGITARVGGIAGITITNGELPKPMPADRSELDPTQLYYETAQDRDQPCRDMTIQEKYERDRPYYGDMTEGGTR